MGELKWGPYFPQSLSIAVGICFDLLNVSLWKSLSQKYSILQIKNVPRPDFYTTWLVFFKTVHPFASSDLAHGWFWCKSFNSKQLFQVLIPGDLRTSSRSWAASCWTRTASTAPTLCPSTPWRSGAGAPSTELCLTRTIPYQVNKIILLKIWYNLDVKHPPIHLKWIPQYQKYGQRRFESTGKLGYMFQNCLWCTEKI